jgi:hypothetical protein
MGRWGTGAGLWGLGVIGWGYGLRVLVAAGGFSVGVGLCRRRNRCLMVISTSLSRMGASHVI